MQNVVFDIENGPTGVTGGTLWTAQDNELIYVGLLVPLNIGDNTYGNTKASDWNAIDHFLIGGEVVRAWKAATNGNSRISMARN